MIKAIEANANLVVETCKGLVDFDFGYDARSVKWLEGYIERLRGSRVLEENWDKFVGIWGSYLGEAIIRSFGGRWAQDQSGWRVFFSDDNQAFPFNKVEKQMRNGLEGGDSIYYFYTLVPHIHVPENSTKSQPPGSE